MPHWTVWVPIVGSLVGLGSLAAAVIYGGVARLRWGPEAVGAKDAEISSLKGAISVKDAQIAVLTATLTNKDTAAEILNQRLALARERLPVNPEAGPPSALQRQLEEVAGGYEQRLEELQRELAAAQADAARAADLEREKEAVETSFATAQATLAAAERQALTLRRVVAQAHPQPFSAIQQALASEGREIVQRWCDAHGIPFPSARKVMLESSVSRTDQEGDLPIAAYLALRKLYRAIGYSNAITPMEDALEALRTALANSEEGPDAHHPGA